jgi:hypothetical protein
MMLHLTIGSLGGCLSVCSSRSAPVGLLLSRIWHVYFHFFLFLNKNLMDPGILYVRLGRWEVLFCEGDWFSVAPTDVARWGRGGVWNLEFGRRASGGVLGRVTCV